MKNILGGLVSCIFYSVKKQYEIIQSKNSLIISRHYIIST